MKPKMTLEAWMATPGEQVDHLILRDVMAEANRVDSESGGDRQIDRLRTYMRFQKGFPALTEVQREMLIQLQACAVTLPLGVAIANEGAEGIGRAELDDLTEKLEKKFMALSSLVREWVERGRFSEEQTAWLEEHLLKVTFTE